MLIKTVTNDFLRAKFLVDILPVLLSKQEKNFILELKYNYVNVTYKENKEVRNWNKHNQM